MSAKNRGCLPLCWMVDIRMAGCALTNSVGPYKLSKAQRVATMAEWKGDSATLRELPEATARHRAIINARRSA